MTNGKHSLKRTPGKWWLAGFLVWGLLFLVGCDNETSDENGPLGPVFNPSLVKVAPNTTSVEKGGTVTFVGSGGTGTYSWTLSDNTFGVINASSGSFTAGNNIGSVTVTAKDTNGVTGQATVSIVAEGLIVTPNTSQVFLGDTDTFTSTGTTPFFWTLNSTTIGNIVTDTGVFTADGSTGSAVVTVVDSLGNVGTAAITVINSLLVVTPSNLALSQIPAAAVAFTATGAVGTVFWDLAGAANGYTGAAIDPDSGEVTITTLPSAVEGDQTLTITADDGNITPGTATLTLFATP